MTKWNLTVKEVEALNKRSERMKARYDPQRVERLEELLKRFVDYFNDAPSERQPWGPMVRSAEDLLEE